MASLQRAVEMYISETRESPFNASITGGTNFTKCANDNPLVTIPNPEIIDDRGRGGSEFRQNICFPYWEPPQMNIAADGDFDVAGRLLLRWAGGAITDTTVVASLAGKHSAPMLPLSSGLQLPSFNVISVLPDTDASFKYTGVVVDQFTLSQEGANRPKAEFVLIGSGKHYQPHAVTSLPSLAAFNCLRPFVFLEYNNGGAIDLAAACDVRSWRVSGTNAHNPVGDRCTGDDSQAGGDPTDTDGPAYNSKLEHRDRDMTGQVVLTTTDLDQWDDLVAGVDITNFVFGFRGADLDPGGTPDTTFEFIKVIIPLSQFTRATNQESDGKFAVVYDLLPKTSGTSLCTIEVQNSFVGAASFV